MLVRLVPLGHLYKTAREFQNSSCDATTIDQYSDRVVYV
jgi:hypothetical protein